MKRVGLKAGWSLPLYGVLSALIFALFSSGMGVGAAWARTFPDTDGTWAQEAISLLSARGVVDGYPNNTFRPDDSVTRAEFARLLIGAMGEEQEAKSLAAADSVFTDMEAHWARPYVMMGHELGLMWGAGDYYYPERFITRQEAAVILGRWLERGGTELDDRDAELHFSDGDEIDDWAWAGLTRAVDSGLFNGFPDGTFRPRDELARAEAVSILSRMMEREGRQYDFHGLLRSADDFTATIRLGSEDIIFKLAANAEIYLNGKKVADISHLSNIRLAFNLNEEGDISFGQAGSSLGYLNLAVSQSELLRDRDAAPSTAADETPTTTATAATARVLAALDAAADTAVPAYDIRVMASKLGMDKLYQGSLSGKGVTIAIIDSGIDPVHPALQRTGQGTYKITDWVNFSSEGTVAIEYTAAAGPDGILPTVGGEVKLPYTLRSVSGAYRYGYWDEEWIAYGETIDFTGNGAFNDRILVLLADQSDAGVYDTVLVDTDSDGDLNDEMPLKVFRDNRYNFASFPVSASLAQGFAFILCDISPDGSQVAFGYDSAGHGTHVAGIIAASGDEITGLAPGAQLLALKVADGTGYAGLNHLLAAVEYAVKKGADIINISLGYNNAGGDAELEAFRRRINEIAANTLICAAAGNSGPGLNSLSSPGDVYNVLSVGACRVEGASGGVFNSHSGSLWNTSSVGPGGNGGRKPDLLAPGAAWSTLPYWTGTGSGINGGSSMATAFVSGTAAILIEDMHNKGRSFNGVMIRDALVGGALVQSDLEQFEQGHGLLNARDSYNYLQKQKSFLRGSELRLYAEPFGSVEGLQLSRYIPERVKLEINNPYQQELRVSWNADQSWLTPSREEMTLPATGSRRLELDISLPDEPGIYTSVLEGVFDDATRAELEIMTCLLVPETWDSYGRLEKSAALRASAARHYLLAVEEGTDALRLNLYLEGHIENLRGRARLYVYRPDGTLWEATDYVGRSPTDASAQRELDLKIEKPMAGIWDVVVYSADDLAEYNLTRSEYRLTAAIIDPPAWSRVDSEFIIGAALPRQEGAVTLPLYILERSTMLPYSGSLLINGRLYQIENGRATITAAAQRGSVTIELIRV